MDLRFKNMLIIGGYDGFVSIGKRANRTQNTLAIKNKILRIFKKGLSPFLERGFALVMISIICVHIHNSK